MASYTVQSNICVWDEYMSTQSKAIPHLDGVSQLTDRVIRILGDNPGSYRLQGTNTYLVGTGRERILIDSGEGKQLWIERIVSHLEKEGLELAYVLLTHWHRDHTGGLADLLAYKPELGPRVYKHTPGPDQHAIHDGQVFQVPGATVRSVFTPGHTIDHMCFLLEEENALFTGDNVLGHGYSVEHDLFAYMASLDKMRGLGCIIGYPGHGKEIADLSAKVDDYIRQREGREKQVWRALVAERKKKRNCGIGSLTIRELVGEAYGNDLSPEAIEWGVEPFVMQVLWKLAEERKVGFQLIQGVKKWFARQVITD
ncbi:Lactamase-like protein adaB [Cladobotryum mycophilum]|uniref:Lactamase-like protein adaB n=1 Tax=Cladobotryum mycophilum TaxID=491253 RepID=A0ABR0SXG7_9HYPO